MKTSTVPAPVKQTPSAGALRAVAAYCNKHPLLPVGFRGELAAIIDRETAAPDLLEALKIAVEYVETAAGDGIDCREDLATIRAAIGKAA